MARCPVCGAEFSQVVPWQAYCSTRCAWRARKRAQRETRAREGRCPQCGSAGDPGRVVYAARPPSYCAGCQAYFARRYRQRRSGRVRAGVG
ncbi:MAG: hypothetical protein AB1816_05400 [Bacillota bacterium]